MKLQAFILAIGLIVAFTFGAATSAEPADDAGLRVEVRQLRDQVSELRQQVDYLMIDHRADKQEVEALAERVRFAEEMQSRVKLLQQFGQPGWIGTDATSQQHGAAAGSGSTCLCQARLRHGSESS